VQELVWKIVGVAEQQEVMERPGRRRIEPMLPVLRTTDDSPTSVSHLENEARRIVGATRGLDFPYSCGPR
jgi:hypothetical protein